MLVEISFTPNETFKTRSQDEQIHVIDKTNINAWEIII